MVGDYTVKIKQTVGVCQGDHLNSTVLNLAGNPLISAANCFETFWYTIFSQLLKVLIKMHQIR